MIKAAKCKGHIVGSVQNIPLKECLKDCIKKGASMFSVVKTTDEGKYDCECYKDNMTTCEVVNTPRHYLHRIVEAGEKVCCSFTTEIFDTSYIFHYID